MVTLGLTFIMGLLGLVVDLGWGYYRKQVAQAAVDSAVMAAVTQAVSTSSSANFTCDTNGIVCQAPTSCATTSSSSIVNAACQYGTANGVKPSNLYVSANTSATGGAAVNYWVSAYVSESLFPTFTRVLGATVGTIGANATGGVVVQNGAGGGCIYTLDPSMAAALQVGGASLMSTCGIYVNSNDSGAMKVNGNNSYVDATGTSINIVGGWACTNGCAYIKPTPTTGVSPAEDPLKNLPSPSPGPCAQVNFNQSANNASTTLDPGTYCGGIKVSGGNVTFNLGMYILNGGGLSFTGNGTTITGNGVFFYNTASGYQVGNLAISGGPTVTLTAPNDTAIASHPELQPYEGILYFRDRHMCPSTNDAVTGNTNTVVSGTFYVHCANPDSTYVPAVLMFSGESTPGHYVGLVADSIKITGNSHLTSR